MQELSFPMRLNKYIAKAGICSRRKAVDLILSGVVTVNKVTVVVPHLEVLADDEVAIEGKPIRPEENKVYILLNKPKDTISTTSDEKNRRTILDCIEFDGKERLFPVGRLDRMTTGLILLTNDGDLTKKLSHPSHESLKKYEVRLDRPLTNAHLKEISKGVVLEDGKAPVKAVIRSDDDKSDVLVNIIIGRNRVVRRIFESLGYQVLRLDRIYYAGLTKKGLPRGHFRHLTSREAIMLKHFH